jgi:spore maturation protein CgeB
MKVRSHRNRALAYQAATSILRYRRHPVSSEDLNYTLAERAIAFRPNLVVVLMGFHIAPEVLAHIKDKTGAVLVNYATDDPFNRRLRTPELIRSIPHYDLFASTKRAIMPDLRTAGACAVSYVRFGYKPSAHFPEPPMRESEREQFGAEVAFVGEGDASRRPFFEALIESIPNLNLALYGGLWNRERRLRKYFRGSVRDRDLRMAFSGAKIVVNLVRRENRDDHVMRTFEAPACGAFVLHERTQSHLEIFKEGHQAAFFESTEELVDKVRYYLAHDRERERIQQSGHQRTVTAGHSYRHRLEEIIHGALY